MSGITENPSNFFYVEMDDRIRRPPPWWARWCLRANPLPIFLLLLATAFWFFWTYSSPTLAMVGATHYDDFFLGVILFGLVAAARAIQLLVRSSCEWFFDVRPGWFRSLRWFWPWLIAIPGATAIMVQWDVPLKVGFWLSRPALDGIADAALADPNHAYLLAGRQAGLYRIAGVEVIDQTVVLYLGRNKGEYGFARVPSATTDVVANVPDDDHNCNTFASHCQAFPEQHGGHDPEGMRMKDDWFVMYSWWGWIKVGWS
jgi:hypothetical protein